MTLNEALIIFKSWQDYMEIADKFFRLMLPIPESFLPYPADILEEALNIVAKHYFANGFYAREMTMPKGCALVGKIHKSEHLCIVSKGAVDIASEERTERISAPYTYVSKPGAKRAIYAHEDTVWTTVHMSDEIDVEKLEDELIAESYLQLESEDKLCLG